MGTTEPVLYGPTHNPWDLGPLARWIVGRIGGRGRGAHRARRARQRHLRFDPHPGRAVRPGRAQADPRPGAHERRHRSTGRDEHRGRRLALGARHRGARRCDHGDVAVVAGTAAAAAARRRAGTPVEPLRIGLWTTAFNGAEVDPACAAAADACAPRTRVDGTSRRRDAHRASSRATSCGKPPRLAMSASAAAEAAAWTDRIGHPLGADDLEPRSWSMVCDGARLSAPELLAVIHTMQRMSAGALRWWDEYDVLVTPTTAGPASPLGDYLAVVRVRASAARSPARSTSPASRPSRSPSGGPTTACHAGSNSSADTAARTH